MNRSTLARRYLPLAAAVAVQVLIIALVPSKANLASSLATGSGPVQGYSIGGKAGAPGSYSGVAGTGTSGSLGGFSSGGSGSLGYAGGSGGSSGGATTLGTTGGASSGGGGGGLALGGGVASGGGGSTAHCVDGREFSPAIDYYAPPCTPGTIGGSYKNGGSTWQGVTGNSITIVDYISNYGAEVNTILAAEGLLETYQDGQILDSAFEHFINTHYVLWGRKIHIITYQGKCQSVPPDYACLLAEMDSVVQTYHPYAVYWDTTLCSACYARLAQDHTVAIGGVGFSDAFADANAPYFWSAGESSTRIELGFARFWCNQLSSTNADRRVSFAQDKNPAQDFNGQKRVLGVISTNDPDNENTVTGVLYPALKADCGQTVNHQYFYAQNINTAAQQVEAGISAMDTPSNPATDVLCLCDPVAPQFLWEGEEQHNYWPENLLADVQGMTLDSSSQNYEAGANNSPDLACPTPSVGCEFNDAFGIMATAPQEPETNDAGVRVFKAGGGTTLPVTPITATNVWANYEMLASLIENTGPDLTPARMAAAAPSMGTIGGGTTGQYEVGFTEHNFNWTIDMRVAYWDPNMPSSYNGAPGTYVQIEGQRYSGNDFPVLNEPPIPATRPS